jgi:hypothetical protein
MALFITCPREFGGAISGDSFIGVKKPRAGKRIILRASPGGKAPILWEHRSLPKRLMEWLIRLITWYRTYV